MIKTRKIMAIALATLMLACAATGIASADDGDIAYLTAPETIAVSIRIEGIGETLYFRERLEQSAGTTVLSLIQYLIASNFMPDIVVTDNALGAYISSINGLSELEYGPMSGWSYRVNGEDPSFGISMFELSDGDSVVYYYGDPFGAGMQYPAPDFSRLYSEGIITFISVDTEYDEFWEPSVKENPVAGALVTLGGEQYETDENGQIALPELTGIAGFNALQIERFDGETGVPTVLRFPPDNEVYIPFSDTPSGIWYEPAVMFCVREWAFSGTDLAENLFSPDRVMNSAELVTVLARLAGVYNVPGDEPWYAASLDWAITNGILAEGDFSAGDGMAKEKMVHLLYLAAALALDRDMDVRADISGAVDFAEIDPQYADSISWAVASGIIQGTSESELVIDPAGVFSRAMICRLLYNYLGE